MSLLGYGLFAASRARGSMLARKALDLKRQRRGGFEPIAADLRAGGHRDVLDGKAILLGSTPELEQHESGVLVGDNTGIMARHIPRWIRHKQSPSPHATSRRCSAGFVTSPKCCSQPASSA